MEFMYEYGLLIAVALPCAVIFAINVLLAIGGERGTLLLPSLRPYPTVYTAPVEAPAAEVADVAPAAAQAVARRPHEEAFAEDEELVAREAA